MEKTQRNKICGHLVDENKNPLNDLEVKAFEYSFLKNKELGDRKSVV